MKEITLIRHAKSDWGEAFLNDADRHLNERGLRDAYFMSEWFAKNKSRPDKILSSPATRALNTALIFARALSLKEESVLLEPKIYEASLESLLRIVQTQNSSYDHLLLFGHNPGFTALCNELSEDVFIDNLPTCGIASYLLNAKSWKEIGSKKCKLNYYEFPKNFKNQN